MDAESGVVQARLRVRLNGVVRPGVGDASKWLTLYNEHYSRKVGFQVVPGSLNVHLSAERVFSIQDFVDLLGGPEHCPGYILMPGTEYGGERDIMMLRCSLFGQVCYLWRTTNGPRGRDVLELIAPVRLREAFTLTDETPVTVDLTPAFAKSSVTLDLCVGNRNYSSWSARAWLSMVLSGCTFTLHNFKLFDDSDGQWRQKLLQMSPTGKAPALVIREVGSEEEHGRKRRNREEEEENVEEEEPHTVWDSLAIAEWAIETSNGFQPSTLAWPAEMRRRSYGRSMVCELHSGFLALRDALPFNLSLKLPEDAQVLSDPALPSGVHHDILRLRTVLAECVALFGGDPDPDDDEPCGLEGPWLQGFGPTIVDVMFGVEVLRLLPYHISLASTPRVELWVRSFLSLPEVALLQRLAAAEPEKIEAFEYQPGKKTKSLHELSTEAQAAQ